MLPAFEAGKLGEHICMVRLLKLGVSCELVNLDTIDIVASVDTKIIRIQVKSSILKGHRQKRSLGYQFNTSYSGKKLPLNKEHCDIVALVATNCERVIFMPVEHLKGQTTKRLPPQKFDDGDFFEKGSLEARSWDKCLTFLFST